MPARALRLALLGAGGAAVFVTIHPILLLPDVHPMGFRADILSVCCVPLRKRFFTDREFASVVLTTELARQADRQRVERAGAEVLVVPAAPAGEVVLAAALGLLRERGVERLLAEGGPQTNRGLVEAGLLDEFLLTVTPRVAGVPDPARITAGLLGGARASLMPVSEFQHRAPDLREWYLRFTVSCQARDAGQV